jgi:hypothetical protein
MMLDYDTLLRKGGHDHGSRCTCDYYVYYSRAVRSLWAAGRYNQTCAGLAGRQSPSREAGTRPGRGQIGRSFRLPSAVCARTPPDRAFVAPYYFRQLLTKEDPAHGTATEKKSQRLRILWRRNGLMASYGQHIDGVQHPRAYFVRTCVGRWLDTPPQEQMASCPTIARPNLTPETPAPQT